MTTKRTLTTIYKPADRPGFLGNGHTARALIQVDFATSDPFILLMDDILDKKDDEPVGGPHPHAGFETVTLLLEGTIGDDEHKMTKGDFQKMTAGSGVIHTETISEPSRMRLLQLWLTLPKKDRWISPKVQNLPAAHVPVIARERWQAKIYAGSFAGVTSPVELVTPIIIADIQLAPSASIKELIPADFNGFFYVIEGGISLGDEQTLLKKDHVGWLNKINEPGESELNIIAGNTGARVILYVGQPQGDPIVSHGPFIADTRDEISKLYYKHAAGEMQHISTIAAERQITW